MIVWTYERGSTKVTSTATEVWELGRGVCQDYSHLALGALRSMGLPRYVSDICIRAAVNRTPPRR